MKVYEVVRIVGLGLQESGPQTKERTGFIYTQEEEAKKKANELWIEETTEEERCSGWCNINLMVIDVEVITKKDRPTVYIDMDDTAVNFTKQLYKYQAMYPKYQYPQSIIGFFSSMEPMPGFLEAWRVLSEHYDMAFCTRPSVYNLGSYTEKAVWVRDNVGFEALENLNLVPKKERIGEEGDYLIDDWDIHGQTEFKGEFMRFGSNGKFKTWEQVTEYLLQKAGVVSNGNYGLGFCKSCGTDLAHRTEFTAELCEDCNI